MTRKWFSNFVLQVGALKKKQCQILIGKQHNICFCPKSVSWWLQQVSLPALSRGSSDSRFYYGSMIKLCMLCITTSLPLDWLSQNQSGWHTTSRENAQKLMNSPPDAWMLLQFDIPILSRFGTFLLFSITKSTPNVQIWSGFAQKEIPYLSLGTLTVNCQMYYGQKSNSGPGSPTTWCIYLSVCSFYTTHAHTCMFPQFNISIFAPHARFICHGEICLSHKKSVAVKFDNPEITEPWLIEASSSVPHIGSRVMWRSIQVLLSLTCK